MITARDRNILQLLLRSPDVGEGWRNVSEVVWPFIENFNEKSLIETEKHDKGGRVRLTHDGRVVCKFAV
jgi:hypothetical protein